MDKKIKPEDCIHEFNQTGKCEWESNNKIKRVMISECGKCNEIEEKVI